MENQLVETPSAIPFKTLMGIIAGLVLVGVIITFAFSYSTNPYINQVLSLQGQSDRGEEIFQFNCAGCHGSQGQGLVGPSLQNVRQHKSRKGIIKQVTEGKTPPMPQFQPSSSEMADLLAFLETL
ncbi:MAG: cytochrome c [Synechococcaceae cyanobacterium RL_1_2]|nr:cytochrome c [Synechococcaceae cyanobacterium RL_1_2]